MQKENKRFKLAKFRFETDSGGFVDRFMMTDNLLPMFEINQWIELKSLRKISTGKDYASKLVVFLNYLNQIGVEYSSANNKHVQDFIHNMIYGNMRELKIKSMEAAVTYSTLNKYVVVITELYKWLYNNYETNIQFKTKTSTIKARKSLEYEPALVEDVKEQLDKLVPGDLRSRHSETWGDDNGFSHIRATFMGPGIMVPIQNGKTVLGTWQQTTV